MDNDGIPAFIIAYTATGIYQIPFPEAIREQVIMKAIQQNLRAIQEIQEQLRNLHTANRAETPEGDVTDNTDATMDAETDETKKEDQEEGIFLPGIAFPTVLEEQPIITAGLRHQTPCDRTTLGVLGAGAIAAILYSITFHSGLL